MRLNPDMKRQARRPPIHSPSKCILPVDVSIKSAYFTFHCPLKSCAYPAEDDNYLNFVPWMLTEQLECALHIEGKTAKHFSCKGLRRDYYYIVPEFCTRGQGASLELCTSGHPVQAGSFSDIHMAHNHKGKQIALKRFRKFKSGDEWQKISEEAKIWGKLRHPNILVFLGTLADDFDYYLASPWQRNGNLMQYMQTNPCADRPLLLCQISSAIAYLHSQAPAIVHGDISIYNILISDEGEALLCDFGLSFVSGVHSGNVLSDHFEGGSPIYMAPELLGGYSAKNTATDTFAFGMLCHEVLSFDAACPQVMRETFAILRTLKGLRPLWSEWLQVKYRCDLLELAEECWTQDPLKRPKMANVRQRLRSITTATEKMPTSQRRKFSEIDCNSSTVLTRKGNKRGIHIKCPRHRKVGF